MNWPEATGKFRTAEYSGVTPTTWVEVFSRPATNWAEVVNSGATDATDGAKTGSKRA